MNIADEVDQCRAVDEGQGLAHLEGVGVVCEDAGRDQDAALGALGRDDAEQLSHLVHADLADLPLLALDEDRFAVASKDVVDAAVCAASPTLFDVISLAAECLAHEVLEFTPRE